MNTLGMTGGEFHIVFTSLTAVRETQDEIDIQNATFSPNGMETIQFQVSTNPGQPLRPMNAIVSGENFPESVWQFRCSPQPSNPLQH